MIVSKDHIGRMCTLVHVKTGQPVQEGTPVTVRGETVKITGGMAPHKPGSSGKVWVGFENGAEMEYYPSVVDAQWLPHYMVDKA